MNHFHFFLATSACLTLSCAEEATCGIKASGVEQCFCPRGYELSGQTLCVGMYLWEHVWILFDVEVK